jgi:hypothetical protein
MSPKNQPRKPASRSAILSVPEPEQSKTVVLNIVTVRTPGLPRDNPVYHLGDTHGQGHSNHEQVLRIAP